MRNVAEHLQCRVEQFFRRPQRPFSKPSASPFRRNCEAQEGVGAARKDVLLQPPVVRASSRRSDAGRRGQRSAADPALISRYLPHQHEGDRDDPGQGRVRDAPPGQRGQPSRPDCRRGGGRNRSDCAAHDARSKPRSRRRSSRGSVSRNSYFRYCPCARRPAIRCTQCGGVGEPRHVQAPGAACRQGDRHEDRGAQAPAGGGRNRCLPAARRLDGRRCTPSASWADAYRRHRGPSVAGDFDYYLLSLSVAPSFCALDRGRRGRSECDTPSDAAYRETPLTVHGLWPNRAGVGVRGQPQDCDGPPLTALPDGLRADLVRYMPGAADGLDRHEWRRTARVQGSIRSRISARSSTAPGTPIALSAAAMQSHGMFGRQVGVQDLLDAVAESDSALARSIDRRLPLCAEARPARPLRSRSSARSGLFCTRSSQATCPRRDGDRMCSCPIRAGFRANSGCPSGAGFLPGGFEAG